jgi:hypothetical protein
MLHCRSALTMPSLAMPAYSAEQLAELLPLLEYADSVELKLSVPEAHRRSTVEKLRMDPIDAQVRQVTFFDTADLALNRAGVVLRARRVQRKAGDSVVKLRPLTPELLTPALRRSPNFGVEVDALPNGFVCSGSMKAEIPDAIVKEEISNRRFGKLFTKQQRAFFTAHAPDGISLEDLEVLGPINVLKLKFTPADLPNRRFAAELWNYPDGARLLELSTKCPPDQAFQIAAQTKAYLAGHGVDLFADQQTKTRTALEFFARELSDGD